MGLGTASLLVGAALGRPMLVAAGLGAAAIVVLFNREFLRTIRVHGGHRRALASVALLWLELLMAGVGAGFGLLGFSFGNRY
jgi:hypothetical protein